MKDVDIITFKTDHPISIPVPDRDLLELHGFGFMMQVLRLAGRMPWDHNKKNCASSVTNGRIAEKDHDLGYTQEVELGCDAAASMYPGSGISSFTLNILWKWQVLSTTRGIWFRTRRLRNK